MFVATNCEQYSYTKITVPIKLLKSPSDYDDSIYYLDIIGDIILVDSNLHREHILHSEKAFAYKMKMDALKKQGKRTDLTSDQVGPKLSAGEVSDTDSASQVKRYIRLTKLIPKLTDLVDSADGDNEIIPFKNVMNEMYARDISKKVRSAKRIRGNMGEPLSQPPYGYMKDPENPKRWIIEHEAASVVIKPARYILMKL